MLHLSSLKSLLSFFLIASFILTPTTLTYSQTKSATDTTKPVVTEEDDDSDDSDDDGESEEERDRRLAEETAAEVFAAAEAAGVMLEIGAVEAVYNASPSGSAVSVGGVSLGKEEALAAISAMGEAKTVGALGVVSVEKTLEAYGSGSVCAGCVVGENTGVTGNPQQVAHAEADYAISTANVVAVRNPNTFAPVPAKDLSGALSKISSDSLQKGVLGLPPGAAAFNIFGDVVVKQTPQQQYAATTQAPSHAGINRLTNTSFTYDPASGNFIGNQTGTVVPASSVPNSDRVRALSQQSPVSVVSIDFKSGSGIVSAQDTMTGRVTNYDSNTGETLNPNTVYNISVSELLYSPTAVSGGSEPTKSTFVRKSPFEDALLGMSVSGQDISTYAETFADILAGENAVIAGKIGRGESLTADEMGEALGIVGVIINRSGATGQRLDRWINSADYSSYNVSNHARILELSRNPSYNHDSIAAFYQKAFTGQLAVNTFSKFTEDDLAPAPFATHFYSGSASRISWADSIVEGSERRIGEHTFVNLHLRGSDIQEYRLKTSGLPDNVTVVDTVIKPLGGVGDLVDPDNFFAGNLLNDEEMSRILSPVFATQSYTRMVDIPEDFSTITAAVPPQNILNAPPAENRIFMENSRAVRSQDITNELQNQLNHAAHKNGVKVVVFSGGQMSLAEARRQGATKGNDNIWRLPNGTEVRVGSERHDNGMSADVYLIDLQTGRKLDMTIAADRAVMFEFLADSVAAGATGIGASVSYMGPHNMHIGGGSVAAWGGTCHCSAGAPQWVKDALEEGLRRRESYTTTTPSPTPSTNVKTPAITDIIPSTGNADLDKVIKDTANTLIQNTIGNVPIINDIVGGIVGLIPFGQGGTGSGPSVNQSGGSDSSGGSSNEFICPPREQITKQYLEQITDSSLRERLLRCPNMINQQAGAIIIPFLNQDWFTRIASIFTGRNSNTVEQVVSASATSKITIPVTIEINSSDRTISLSREDITDILERKTEYYTHNTDELMEVVAILEEDPIVFDEDGSIIYSNGLYSPAVVDGYLLDTSGNYEYVYLLKYVDENGNVTEVENDISSLPENAFTNILGMVFTNRSPFYLAQVEEITYRLTDPNINTPGDEYYDYVLKLSSGQTRGVIVPQYSSVEMMRERFAKIGYQGDVLALISQASENTEPPKPSMANRVFEVMRNITGRFMGALNMSDTDTNQSTNLPQFDGGPTVSDIRSVFIYPSATIECPTGVPGFMYSAVLSDRSDAGYSYVVTDGRCGYGEPEELVAETARHLGERYSIKDTNSANFVEKVTFQTQPVLFNPGITKLAPQEITTTPTDVVPDLPDSTGSTTSQLPNLTNEIVFEVKAVASDGRVLADWIATEKITITEGVQLYFRWNGTAYQQCLPFLNDNGNYSLTRSNRAMLTGNTEEEQYNIIERNGLYRLECGGQRNNEFGVDSREIEVVVN